MPLQNRPRLLVPASGALPDRRPAKLGEMTKHGHLAVVTARQCFCQGVFTRPRAEGDIGRLCDDPTCSRIQPFQSAQMTTRERHDSPSGKFIYRSALGLACLSLDSIGNASAPSY